MRAAWVVELVVSVGPMSAPVVAEIVRSGFVEGHHYGSAVAIDASGAVLMQYGDVTSPILPRSCNKPVQALGMLHCGLDLHGELLALACASHSGEPFHVAGVRQILASAGLTEADLQTPAAYPLDDEARDAVLREGGGKASILMNCSGKHAAMLATCVQNRWSTHDYLSPQHPLQVALAQTFGALSQESLLTPAPTDGCGAPIFTASLVGLARAFSTLAAATSGPEFTIAEAIRRHPEFVSGTHRDEHALLTAIPGAIGKAGAESCYVVALSDGRAVAVKQDDGAPRVRPVVMAAILERLGVFDEPGVDVAKARATGVLELTGGAQVVGEIRASLPL
jgi:L-asparaginase II